MILPCDMCADFRSGSGALRILGAPLFDDSTGGSNWCLKLCPGCGAMFEWEHEYTYLVGGSEDATYIKRLDDRTRPRAMRELFRWARIHSAPETPPRTTRLMDDRSDADVVVPIQQGTPLPRYPMMEALRAKAPISADELAAELVAHARFVAGGGAGGGWMPARTCVEHADALLFAFYGCPTDAVADQQARLALQWLVPIANQHLELPSADLLAVQCRDADLQGATVHGAMLIRADLAGSSLRGAILAQADCTGAKLRGCDLRDADLRGTDFEGADLTGAQMRGALLARARFPGACTVGISR